MKQRILLFTLLLLFGLSAFAGGDKYTEAMKSAMTLLDSAKTPEDYQVVANKFERIGNAEQKQWLPFYYAALSYTFMSYMEPDVAKVDPILDKAQAQLTLAKDMKLKDEELAEVYVLEGMILGARIRVEPQTRGMSMGPQSSMSYQKAKSLDPTNPRVLSMMGQSTMFTPKQFGGGRDKAIPMLEEAEKAFGTFQPKTELHPTWGRTYNAEILRVAKSGEQMPWEKQPEETPAKEGGQ